MQKTRKRHETRRPEIVDIDQLSMMPDEELIQRFRALCDGLFEAPDDPIPWEIEIAYVRREQQLRGARRMNHSAWVKAVEEKFWREEELLLVGDFDNFVYVYASTNGRPPRWS